MNGNSVPISSEMLGKDYFLDKHWNRKQPFTVWHRPEVKTKKGWEVIRFCRTKAEAKDFVAEQP